MKHLILAAALLGFTATTSLAQSTSWPAPPTAAQVQALKQDIINKKADFQASVQANKRSKAEAEASDLLKLMKKHVVETRYTAQVNTGAARDAIMAHMLTLENSVIAFMHKNDDVMANSADLLTATGDFLTNY